MFATNKYIKTLVEVKIPNQKRKYNYFIKFSFIFINSQYLLLAILANGDSYSLFFRFSRRLIVEEVETFSSCCCCFGGDSDLLIFC